MNTNIAQIQSPLKPTNIHLCYGISPCPLLMPFPECHIKEFQWLPVILSLWLILMSVINLPSLIVNDQGRLFTAEEHHTIVTHPRLHLGGLTFW